MRKKKPKKGRNPEKNKIQYHISLSVSKTLFTSFSLNKQQTNRPTIEIARIALMMINEYERRNLYFDAGILAQGLNKYRKSYDILRMLIERFSEGNYPADIKKLVQSAIEESRDDKFARKKVLEMYKTGKHFAYVLNPPASKSKAAHWVLGNSSKIIGIAIYDFNSGRNLLDISTRGRDLVDLREIVQPIAMRLGGSGGGHKKCRRVQNPKSKIE